MVESRADWEAAKVIESHDQVREGIEHKISEAFQSWDIISVLPR